MSTSAGKKPETGTGKNSKPKADPVKGASTEDQPAKDAPATGRGASAKPSDGDTPTGGVSDVQRKMREALEAKQAKSRSAHGEDHLGGHGVGASSNDVTKRQFRRKSGG